MTTKRQGTALLMERDEMADPGRTDTEREREEPEPKSEEEENEAGPWAKFSTGRDLDE